jgi:septal ring factor EnvC (AmiA/AmiB activator)
MQAVFQELQELITVLNGFAPALEQAIGRIKSLRAELNSLKGEELAEDEKQAKDEEALLGTLRAFTSTISTMSQKVTEVVAEEPAPVELEVGQPPVQPDTAVQSVTTIPPVPPVQIPTA